MGLTFYKYVPVIIVPWLYWGVGFALPFCIVTLNPEKRDIVDLEFKAHLEHEFTHFKQWWKLGIIGFPIWYLVDLFKHGYDSQKHHLENEAREAELLFLKNKALGR